jgi:tRNA U34 2-thiouridine synthase MnmA/TrmU
MRDNTIELAEPTHGVAPGQTACLMRGDQVIGWGTIAPAARAAPTPTRESELSHAL